MVPDLEKIQGRTVSGRSDGAPAGQAGEPADVSDLENFRLPAGLGCRLVPPAGLSCPPAGLGSTWAGHQTTPKVLHSCPVGVL